MENTPCNNRDNIKFSIGGPGLFEAAEKGDVPRVKGLLNASHHPDTHRDSNGNTSVHAASGRGHTECLNLLVDAGGTLIATNYYGKSPLHMAVDSHQYDTTKWIIEHPDGSQCLNMGMGPERKTPLKLATENGNKQIITLLREKGASIKTGKHLYFHCTISLI